MNIGCNNRGDGLSLWHGNDRGKKSIVTFFKEGVNSDVTKSKRVTRL